MATSVRSQAISPQTWISAKVSDSWKAAVLSVVLGVVLISALAQVAIPLPFTPVPVTGQTFGVTLVALLWGRKLGVSTLFVYLMAGAAGAPVFAKAASGLSFGPTLGYLVGMLFASAWVGWLADKGKAKTFGSAFLVGWSGSLFVFGFGLLGLSFFVPRDQLIFMGLLPFIPGDLIKTAIAAGIASRLNQKA